MDGVQYNIALLETIGRTPGPAAERALMQMLECTTGPTQAAVLRQLLSRGGEAVVSHAGRLIAILDEPARKMLIASPAMLEPIVRVGINSSNPAIRQELTDLLGKAGTPSSAYLLARAANDQAVPVRRRAAKALLQLVRDNRDDASAVARHLAPAVVSVMRNYKGHQSADSLRSAIVLGRRCPKELLEYLDAPANRLSGPLMQAMKSLRGGEVGEFVFAALAYPLIGRTAAAFIAQADWPTLAALGADGHWLAIKHVREMCEGIHNLRAVTDDPAGLADLPAGVQGPVLRLIMACGISVKLKEALFSIALAGEAQTARTAMSLLLASRLDTADLVLMGLHCRCSLVRAVAVSRIMACGADANVTEHLLEVLPALGDADQNILGQYLAAVSFQRYWQVYKKLDPEIRKRAGMALLKLDGRVADHLAGRLIGRDVNGQLQATQMVQQLNLAGRFSESLARLARQGHKVVRSAAAMTLGDVDDFNAARTLARCLDDEDPRVQANSVEALAKRGGEASAVLDKADSPHNRVRANAVHWLINADHEQGPMALAAMLTDRRPMHRISALWVVKDLEYAPAVTLLHQLATLDPDTKVRARAATIAQQIRQGQTMESAS